MGILNWFKHNLKHDQVLVDNTVAPEKNQPGSRVENHLPDTEISNKDIFNSGTYVSTEELIKLQAQGRKLDLSQRTFARASTTGSHHSRFRGRGMDYQESRIYQAGDDIRSMDWRVTARAGKPHTKLYQEERERPVVLLVDFNPGMFFGSKNVLKSVLAAQTAALLGWAAAARGDRVGALIIGSQVNDGQGHKELQPKMGKRGALQLIRELVKQADPHQVLTNGIQSQHDKNQAENSQANNLNEELKRLRRISRPGSLIFIISDFYDIDDSTDNHLLRLSHHNDLMAIQIIDPLELQAPPAGEYAVTNGKLSGILNTRSKKTQQTYNTFFNEHHKAVAELMRKRKIPLLRLSTSENPVNKLQQQFGSARQRASVVSKVA